MLSRLLRVFSTNLLRPIIQALIRLGVTPNQLTLASLVMAAVTGSFAALGWFAPAAIAMLVCGLFDSLDGELARQSGAQSPFGAFLDSICDHYGDFFIILGITIWTLRVDSPLTALLALVALFGSVVGSQIRSRAGMVGIDTKNVGIFTRFERTIVLILGFAARLVLPALIVLALGNHIAALQRLAAVIRAYRPAAS